jgi:hypothetical protein
MSTARTTPKKPGRFRRLFGLSQSVAAPVGSIPDNPPFTIPLPSRSQHAIPRIAPTLAPSINQELDLSSSPSLKSPPAPNAGPNQVALAVTPGHMTGSSIPASQPNLPCPRRDLWNEALKVLSKKDKTLVLDHVPPATTPISEVLETLMQIAQDKRRACESKRWTVKFREHVVVLSQVADKVIAWLDKFKQIGDIAANVDPLHAGLPWAGVRLLLQVCCKSEGILQ